MIPAPNVNWSASFRYHWDGKELKHVWTVDFIEQKLGRAHQMRFGSYALYASFGTDTEPSPALAQR